ncbi:DUF6252 family protein [Capnocytophaga sp.]|uniref:DUF6252 family protein n=1 Tax=Capnocytophaga sp. TaxID=44737 RepID=UPI0026DD82B1|nr:DUF6252 family protein [Capnocytophaga sp.]MDO5105179.1 DUF6252 family protein [Capnocytophaga sp.]
MRSLLKNYWFLALLAIVFVGCSRSEGSDDGSYFIKMRVDDRAVVGKPIVASFNKYRATVGNEEKDLIHITFSCPSNDDSLENITVSMSDFKGPGTYDLKKPENPQNTAQYAKNITIADEVCGAVEGKIVITGITETSITGTFQFRGVNHTNSKTVKITDGSFHLPLKKS